MKSQKLMSLFLALVLTLFLAINLASASSYYIEFNQVGDKLVIKEAINNISREAYVTSEGLEKSSEGYYFVKKMVFNQSYDGAQIRINLDQGIIIKNSEVFPAGYKIESDGQIISIAWNLQNVRKGENFAMFVNLEDTKVGLSLVWWAVGIALILIIGYFFYRKVRHKEKIEGKAKRKKGKNVKHDKRYEHLLDTEKKVIEELKKANRNELWQKQIQNATGYSKAKVSRLVRNLETRGLISKIPFGNTNKVRLK